MKFAPYSFSKISSFQTCPLRFKFDYIDKLGKFQKSKALEKGSFIHLWLEKKGLGITEKPEFKFSLSTPEDVKVYEAIYHKFIETPIAKKYLNENVLGVEIDFGVKYDEGKMDETSYWNKQALMRGKIDHALLVDDDLTLIDWKTGKVNPWQNDLQLVMYAVWGFLKYPDVETINGAFVYIEHGEEKPYTYHRKDLNALKARIAGEIRNIETEGDFPKKESALCNYCSYRELGLCKPESGDDFANKFMKYN